MSETWLVPHHEKLSVTVVRSKRARRLSLRVGRSDGVVRLTIPAGVGAAQARAFVAAQRDWIVRNVERAPQPQRVGIGERVPLLGRDVEVVTSSETRVARYDGARLLVPDDAAKVGPRMQALLKTMARTHLRSACDDYAHKLGVSYGKITLRDTRSRWGSCTSRGDLMFSWRLIMAPPDKLAYVAAHEVAHLVHMDHSARFWAVVERLMPDYAAHRAWFREAGPKLLAWDFSTG